MRNVALWDRRSEDRRGMDAGNRCPTVTAGATNTQVGPLLLRFGRHSRWPGRKPWLVSQRWRAPSSSRPLELFPCAPSGLRRGTLGLALSPLPNVFHIDATGLHRGTHGYRPIFGAQFKCLVLVLFSRGFDASFDASPLQGLPLAHDCPLPLFSSSAPLESHACFPQIATIDGRSLFSDALERSCRYSCADGRVQLFFTV